MDLSVDITSAVHEVIQKNLIFHGERPPNQE